jgi:hypothetical protein
LRRRRHGQLAGAKNMQAANLGKCRVAGKYNGQRGQGQKNFQMFSGRNRSLLSAIKKQIAH